MIADKSAPTEVRTWLSSRLRGVSGNSEALLRPLKRPVFYDGLGRRAGVGEKGS